MNQQQKAARILREMKQQRRRDPCSFCAKARALGKRVVRAARRLCCR